MAIHKTEAIVLRTMDYSETSLIVWLFTREHGRVHLIAKGARRTRSPFEGALEPLIRGELLFYRKKKSGGGLDIAKEFDPIDLHTGLRRDLGRLYRGLYLGELLTELSEQEAPSEEAYAAAQEGLALMARGEPGALEANLLRTELRLIAAAGLAPCLEVCTSCGVSCEDGPMWFSAPAGGVLCPEHAKRDPSAWRVSSGAMKTLRALAQGKAVGVGREVGQHLRELLDRFLTHHLGKQLRLPRYLRVLLAAPRRPEPARRTTRAASSRLEGVRG